MQVDKLTYFALLVKKCVNEREPRSDPAVTRIFIEALNSFKKNHNVQEEYKQNERSIQYIIAMSRELEIIYRNNKLTPWGTAIAFFTPDNVPVELPMGLRILFLRAFLLENYAFIRSLHDHIREFSIVRDSISWYRDIKALPQTGLLNSAFSVYINALKLAYKSADGIAVQRRYLALYRQAMKKGKTAKALIPKIKPSLGLMEDLDLLKKRRTNNDQVSLRETDGHEPYAEIMKRFPDYKTLVAEDKRFLTSILLEVYGYIGERSLPEDEVISVLENLYTSLADPIFNVCDLDTLVNVFVTQKKLEGYKINEIETREAIVRASRKDRYKYQILPDRQGKNRFIKIKR
jgi:hypothetical protein